MDVNIVAPAVALLVGSVTAALSYVKFITDKENTTTSFRQAWINALRNEIGLLIACSRQEISLRLEEDRLVVGEQESKEKAGSASGTEDKQGFLNDAKFYEDSLKAIQASRVLAKHEYRTKFNLVKLYFKLGDQREGNLITSFLDAKKFADSFRFNTKVSDEEAQKEVDGFYEQLDKLFEKSSDLARAILKDEWERVKSGEEIYKKTRKFVGWFIIGFIVAFITFIAFVIASEVMRKPPEKECREGCAPARQEMVAPITNNINWNN